MIIKPARKAGGETENKAEDKAGDKESPLTRKIKYAPFNMRLLAAIIDFTIVMSLGYPLSVWVDTHMFNPVNVHAILMLYQNPLPPEEFKRDLWMVVAHEHLIERTIATNLFQIFLLGLYIIPCWMRYNSTPGKMIVGIEIRDAVTQEYMTKRQKIIRFFSYILSGIPFALGFVWMIFNRKRQTWHDKLAGTIVVSKGKKRISLTLRSASQ